MAGAAVRESVTVAGQTSRSECATTWTPSSRGRPHGGLRVVGPVQLHHRNRHRRRRRVPAARL